MRTITSPHNPHLAALKKLHTAKGRREAGCYLVEGAKLCTEALRDGEVLSLLCDMDKQEAYAPLLSAARDVLLAPAHLVAGVCQAKTPQGIVAAVALPAPLSPEAATGSLLILDGVQDPGNVGTMLRTAEAAGFSGALLSETCADAFAPKTVRATMGSILRLPLYAGPLEAAMQTLICRGYTLISAELGGQPIGSWQRPDGPLALIIGSEGHGVRPAISALCQGKISLPMGGRAESLNAAVAAGILMYSLLLIDNG